MRIITQQQIRDLGISAKECVDWIRLSFATKPEAQLPAKISVHPKDQDFYTTMPCLLPADEKSGRRYFGVKVVYRNSEAEPSLGSEIMLYDTNTGALLALMDADWITTMRTGAVAALSAKTLRTKDANKYGFVGLGNTARAAMMCILEQEPERHFDVQLLRYKDQAESFVERFKDYKNVTFTVVDDICQMASSVDVFISCITSANALLVPDESCFKPGVTVIPVHMRGLQNCDVTFDRVFGDDTAHICNFKYFNQYHDYNEIGEVLAGRDPGRKSETQRIIDYNYGLGLHDVIFASKIYERLLEAECIEVEMPKETQKFWI